MEFSARQRVWEFSRKIKEAARVFSRRAVRGDDLPFHQDICSCMVAKRKDEFSGLAGLIGANPGAAFPLFIRWQSTLSMLLLRSLATSNGCDAHHIQSD